MMQTVRSFETWVKFYQTTPRHVEDDSNLISYYSTLFHFTLPRKDLWITAIYRHTNININIATHRSGPVFFSKLRENSGRLWNVRCFWVSLDLIHTSLAKYFC